MERLRKKVCLVALMWLMAGMVWAQPGNPGGDPDNPVPIGGIEILLALGGALGVRKFHKAFRERK